MILTCNAACIYGLDRSLNMIHHLLHSVFPISLECLDGPLKNVNLLGMGDGLMFSRRAEGPGREILQRPLSVLSVRLSVCPSVCPSHLVFTL